MNHYWELVQSKVEAMPLRERIIMFAAIAFAVIALTSTMLLNPLLAKQKTLTAKLAQQQAQMKDLQVKVQTLSQARKEDEHSPLRATLAQLKQQVNAQDEYIKSRRSHFVEPSEIVSLLKHILNKNEKLQLTTLETLPTSLVTTPTQSTHAGQRPIYKHPVRITLHGNYVDLLQYLTTIEKAKIQMYWEDVSLSVSNYPEAEFVLTLYTLSFDKTWLKV